MMTRFSVLMSLYDGEDPDYLDLALRSVFGQTPAPDQVVLVLDGPVGAALEAVVGRYKVLYPALEVYPQPENRGLSAALRIGLELCRNEIVFRMDTDDICYPDRYARVLEAYREDPSLEIVGTFATIIDEAGTETRLMRVPVTQEEIYRNVWTCPFIHPAVSFRKSAILRIGSYNPAPGLRMDDYELWFRCVENGLRCVNLAEPTLYHRFFRNNLIKNNFRVAVARLKVFWKHARRCKCPAVAYLGVLYPLIRSCFPPFIRVRIYQLADKFNPRSK